MTVLNTLWADLKYMFYTILHPFDGFYEIRFRRKRNYLLMVLIFAAYGLTSIFKAYYSGFMFTAGFSYYGSNNLYMIFSALFPFVLFAVANWSITTLFDGNGGFLDILIVLSCALLPKLIFDIVSVVMSNFLVQEEMMLYTALTGCGMFIFGFLVFAGLCVAHEYSAAKNILTILATLIAAVIIIFIGMLYLQIMGKIIGFVNTIATELSKRW